MYFNNKYLNYARQKRVSYQHTFFKVHNKVDFIRFFFKYHTYSLALTNRDYILMSKNNIKKHELAYCTRSQLQLYLKCIFCCSLTTATLHIILRSQLESF